ncbi:Transcription factor [Colletotrichum scovillei]|nr:Transcription factor [Colletotrichum scovillei]
MNTRTVRDRANVVCVDCHSRKVRCDLQDSPLHGCANCRRAGVQCIRRDGVRKSRKMTARQRQLTLPRSPTVPAVPSPPILSTDRTRVEPRILTPARSSELNTRDYQPGGFISHASVLSYDSATEPMAVHDGLPPRIMQARDVLVKATEADTLPAPSLRKALTDAFFEFAFPYFPVVDAEDLSRGDSSILLQQAVCLVGSLMRHDPNSMTLSYSLYEKIETLIHVEFEKDNVFLLQTLCLLSCWAPASPYLVTLHGPWHWTGMAVRLAVQMGIHTRSSYREKDNSGSLRRIFWHLINSETLMVACWGRPSSLKLADCDVQPLAASDFVTQGVLTTVSLQFTGLMNVIGKLSELNTRKGVPVEAEVESVITSLCEWKSGLPDVLRLYDADGTRRSYHRYTSELHIHYLTAIIIVQMLSKSRHALWRTSHTSVLAATCIAELYEEIHYREDSSHLLSINGFMSSVAAIVLVFHRPDSSEKETIRKNGIESICSVLRVMSKKYGGARSVLQRIQGLQLQAERRQTSDHNLQDDTSSSSAPWVARSVHAHLRELLPFPLTFDENADILDLAEAGIDRLPDDRDVAATLTPVENVSDAMFSLMDILEMDFDPFDNTSSFV